MTPEQLDDWRAIRAEQATLRARLEQLEARLARFEREEPPPATVPPVMEPVPPPLPSSPADPPPLPPAVGTTEPPPISRRPSVEERVGTAWLVRVGVVLLLTSLAFLGDYLYTNIVPRLGPASKVGLMYLGAGALAGLGAWLERSRAGRENPQVHQYARVVLAGGLAAVYYVTYAAHYNPHLRLVGSPLLAGALLLGWAGFMVWLADRRGSETLATFAILLTFYTSAINEVGGFTLAANLPLAAGVVLLMRRHLWRVFPFMSLLATFGSYAYWRYFHVYAAWRGLTGAPPAFVPAGGGGFWVEVAFLSVYWLLFTGAVFTTREAALPAERRAGFAGLNNGAFFLLATWSVLADYPDAFWKWSLGFGVVLIALAEGGRRLPRRLDAPTETTFLLEGVLLVTLGFINYFSGWQLSLVLAAQSVVVLAAARRRVNGWLLAASLGTAAGAFALVVWQLNEPGNGRLRVLAPAVAALLAFDAFLAGRWPAVVDPPAGGPRTGPAAAGLYELLVLGLALVWGNEYFPSPVRFALFALAGAGVFAGGVLAGRRRWTWWGYVLAAAGLFYFWLDSGPAVQRQPVQWLGVAILVAWQQFGRRRGPAAWFPVWEQAAVIVAAVLTAWTVWSLTVLHRYPEAGFALAVGWSIFAVAVFAAGLALHERVYRLSALVVLVATLGHVVLFDIWRLDSLERFVSLLCLGVVLLGIGFFYTRYAARLRDLF